MIIPIVLISVAVLVGIVNIYQALEWRKLRKIAWPRQNASKTDWSKRKY